MTSRVRIVTPSRLHFGLLGWGPQSPRQFGGVGLMVERPGLEILAEAAPEWQATGPLAERALEVAVVVAEKLKVAGFPVGPVRLTNRAVPEAHIGLGVGTQLSLAVARALAELAGMPHPSVDLLARLTGRGRRSGIGIHGFAEGGLIVDAGRRGARDLPTKLIRLPFPPSWSVLIVLPEAHHGLHGDEELNAFHALPPMPESVSARLCQLILLGLLPGLIETDLEAFGSSLAEIQRTVGTEFAPVQGGRFGNPALEAVGEAMTRLGLHGVGQSSWGPTLYGFSDRPEAERAVQLQTLRKAFPGDMKTVFWTHASPTGAIVITE